MKCINEFLRTVIAQKLGAEVTEAEDKTAFFHSWRDVSHQ